MRNFIFFILFLFPIVASAQFPANPRKMRLGYQTTADGLIYRASGAPNFTPADSDDARVYIDTETGDLYVYNSGWIKTARKTDAITRVDTVNQINHGFSVGDPLWKSGDYILARDTGLSVTVSGIVIDSFDANTFYVQRNGVFTLTGHGFTVDQQLYVQPDGSYSAADTVNSLVYGFAIDANTIQIGVKPAAVLTLANAFDNSISGLSATTKSGAINELKLRGDTIKVYRLSYISVLADSADIKVGRNAIDISLTINDTTTQDYALRLPDVSAISNKTISVRGQKNVTEYNYYINPVDSLQLYHKGRPVKRYYVDEDEEITLNSNGSYYDLKTNYKPLNYIDRNRRYSLGDKIGSYIIEGAPPAVKSSTTSTSTFYNASLTIPLLAKNTSTRNYFYDSEDLYAKGADTKWSTTFVDVEVDAILDPFGLKTAEKWQKTSGSTNTVQAFNTMPKVLGPYVFSGWIRPGDEAYNDNMQVRIDFRGASGTAAEVTLPIDMSLKEWQYYEEVVTLTDSLGNADTRVEFKLIGDDDDYIYVSRFQIHPGNLATEYKKTSRFQWTESTDTVFAVYYPTNGIFNLGEVAWLPGTTGDEMLIQADSFCRQTRLCNTIQLADDIYTYNQVDLSPYVTLDGNGYSIYYEGSNTSDIVINFSLNGEFGTTAFKQVLQDVNIYANRRCLALVGALETNQLLLDRVYTFGQDSADYCRYFYGEPADLASLGIYDRGGRMEGCRYGFYMPRQNRAVIENARILDQDIGIYANSGSFTVKNSSIESNDTLDIFATGGAIDLRTVYFESTPDLDTNGYRINIQRAGSLYIDACYFNGGVSSAGAIAAIYTDSVNNVEIKNTFFASTSTYLEPYRNTCNTKKWTFENNYTDYDEAGQFKIDGLYSSPNVCSANRVLSDPRSYFGHVKDKFNYSNGRLENTITNNPTLADSIFLSGAIFANRVQNLFLNNEDLAGGAFTDFKVDQNVDLKSNGTAGVSADSTAERLVTTASISGSRAYTSVSMSENLEIGETYCISWYAKTINLAGGGRPYFIFRTSATTDDVNSAKLTASNTTYTRYWVQFVPDAADSDIDIRFAGGLSGDTIVISEFQVHKGSFPLPYLKTGASAPADEAKITVSDQDNILELTGGLNITTSLQTDSLLDSSGNVGTSGQVAVSTGSGWAWRSLSYGEVYIDYIDPDSVTVVTAGNLYDFTDVSEGSSSSDVTVSTTTGRLTYTGTTEKLFQITWSATVTSDAVNENLIGTVMDNGSTITRIRWEEEDTAAGDRHSVSASGFFSMGQNDWVQPKLTSQSNGTQIEVITMSFRIQEVR